MEHDHFEGLKESLERLNPHSKIGEMTSNEPGCRQELTCPERHCRPKRRQEQRCRTEPDQASDPESDAPRLSRVIGRSFVNPGNVMQGLGCIQHRAVVPDSNHNLAGLSVC